MNLKADKKFKYFKKKKSVFLHQVIANIIVTMLYTHKKFKSLAILINTDLSVEIPEPVLS